MYIFKNKETWHFEVEILEEIHFRVIALWGNWCEHEEESQSIQTGIFLILSQENKVGVHRKAKGVWNTWRKVFLFLSYGFILEVLLEFTQGELLAPLWLTTLSIRPPSFYTHTPQHQHTHLQNLHYTVSTLVTIVI